MLCFVFCVLCFVCCVVLLCYDVLFGLGCVALCYVALRCVTLCFVFCFGFYVMLCLVLCFVLCFVNILYFVVLY